MAIERTFTDFKEFLKAVKAAERLNLAYEAHKSWDEVQALGNSYMCPEWLLSIETDEFPAAPDTETRGRDGAHHERRDHQNFPE